jgi:hypothetical protein
MLLQHGQLAPLWQRQKAVELFHSQSFLQQSFQQPYLTAGNSSSPGSMTTAAADHSFFTQRRQFTSSTGAMQEAQQPLLVLPMPSLSHTMTSGRVTKWLKAPGDVISIYDIIAEVTTDSLVEEAYKVDDFAGSVTLLLESQEEAVLAAVLVPVGQEVKIGAPIAVLCEEDGGVDAAKEAAQQIASLDMYDDAAVQQQQTRSGVTLQLLEWQSYLKDSQKGPGDSCGCM